MINVLNIPKLRIKKIGGFNDDGSVDAGWCFDGKSHPNSIGHYIDAEKNIYLIAGYTVSELRAIHAQHNKH